MCVCVWEPFLINKAVKTNNKQNIDNKRKWKWEKERK